MLKAKSGAHTPPPPSNTPTKLLDDLCRHARIPIGYWKAEVDSCLLRYVDHLKENLRDGIGLLLVGGHGIGKTYQACAIAKEALKLTPRVLYIGIRDLIQVYRPTDEFTDASLRMFDDDISMETALRNRRFLVIDDLGQEYRGSGSGYSELCIVSLIRHRIQNRRSTVITTNFTVPQLMQTYKEGFMSLLQEGLVTVPLKGEDRRREARNELLKRSGFKKK
jgi:DNA replication protein DnaC